MKKYILFTCFVLFHTASSLKCYSCDGPTCETDPENWRTETCYNDSGPFFKYTCLKLLVIDKETQETYVERKCAAAPVKDGRLDYTCRHIKYDHVECPVCQTDLCNSATSVSFSLVALCSVVLAYVAPKLL